MIMFILVKQISLYSGGVFEDFSVNHKQSKRILLYVEEGLTHFIKYYSSIASY
mgnify:CR=1 FL=1